MTPAPTDWCSFVFPLNTALSVAGEGSTFTIDVPFMTCELPGPATSSTGPSSMVSATSSSHGPWGPAEGSAANHQGSRDPPHPAKGVLPSFATWEQKPLPEVPVLVSLSNATLQTAVLRALSCDGFAAYPLATPRCLATADPEEGAAGQKRGDAGGGGKGSRRGSADRCSCGIPGGGGPRGSVSGRGVPRNSLARSSLAAAASEANSVFRCAREDPAASFEAAAQAACASLAGERCAVLIDSSALLSLLTLGAVGRPHPSFVFIPVGTFKDREVLRAGLQRLGQPPLSDKEARHLPPGA